MALVTAKSKVGTKGLLAIFKIAADGISLDGTAGAMTPLIEFDRIVNGSSPPVGTFQKSGVTLTISNAERSSAFNAFADDYISETIPEKIETTYQNGDKSSITQVGTAVKVIGLYYEATDPDGNVPIWAMHGVLSGATGDLTDVDSSSQNATAVEFTTTEVPGEFTIDASAVESTFITTPAAITIPDTKHGVISYQAE